MTPVTYAAAPGSRLSDEDAQRIATFLDRKFGDRPRTPADVVNVARPKRSPIHGDFEWDNEVAGEAWRREQARKYLRCIVVVHPDKPEPRRAFHSVTVENGERHVSYVPERVVWASPSLAAEVREQARRELVLWTARYEQYDELADLVVGVREALAA